MPESEAILTRRPPDPDLRIAYGDNENHFMDVWIPAGGGPYSSIFVIHGGYWRARYDLTYTGHLCAALSKAGVLAWNVEYRRVGQIGGGWPGTFDDIRAAYRFLWDHRRDSIAHFNFSRMCVAGHSAGGQLALC